jgi:hyperosmotically inducible protein
LAAALAVAACGREGPPEGDPRAQAPIEETRQAEKAADAGKPLSDASLTQIVRAALESESSLDARKIDVENREGVVSLHGTVASEEQKDKAGRIVGSVGGVKTVDNRLTVDESASTGSSVVLPEDGAAPPATGKSTPRRE